MCVKCETTICVRLAMLYAAVSGFYMLQWLVKLQYASMGGFCASVVYENVTWWMPID